MNRIDERLKVMNVDTSKMSKEQKFSAATGLTFYNEKLEKNGWYVPGGSANVSTEPEEEPIVPDPVSPDEESVVRSISPEPDDEEPVVSGSDEYTEEEPVVTGSEYPDEEPVVYSAVDEEPIVPSSTVEPTDNAESTPSEIEIETKP